MTTSPSPVVDADSPSPVIDAELRARRYWFTDGLTNLVLGVGCLSMALAALFPPRRPALVPMALWLAALGIYGAAITRNRQIVEWLKERITYPRTGYVQSRLPLCNTRREAVMGALVVVATLGTIFIKNPWVCTVAGVMIAAGLWVERKDARMSWVILGGFPIVGLLITLFLPARATPPDRALYFLAGWGVLFALDGLIALVRYLIRNPVARAAA